MMKKILFIPVILVLFSALLQAQSNVTVQLRQPPPYSFHVEDLWKVTLTNPSDGYNVYLVGTVNKGSQKMAYAQTAVFYMPKGFKYINAREIGPVDVEKYTDEVDKTLSHTGSFPSGIYNICIYAKSSATNQVVGSFCGEYEILNVTKSELLSPDNRETVLDNSPNFNWLPPSPIPPSKIVKYEIKFYEILERQTAYYATTSNPVWFSQKDISSTVFRYPIAARQFKTGRKYAWLVNTYIDNNLLTSSEVWEFKCENISQNIKTANDNFYKNFSKDTVKGKISISDIQNFSETKRNESVATNNISLSSNEKISVPDFKTINIFSAGDAIKKDNWFKFTGSYRTEYSHSEKTAVGSQLPNNIGSIRLDPTISIYNIPFTLNLYFDTQQDNMKQNINSFALLLNPSLITDFIKAEKDKAVNKAKSGVSNWLKAISHFKTFGIGETYPVYSPYTLNGVKATGVDMEFNPGLFYLAFSGLKNLDALPDNTFRRDLLAGRIGIGEKEKSHFHLTAMKVWDKESSINLENATISPQENIVFGTSAKLQPFGEYFEIGGEFAASMLTRDVTAPDLVIEDFPKFLSNFIKPKVSSSFDFMYEIKMKVNIDESNTKLEAGFKSVGPGYTSLGAPNIRQDINSLQFNLTQSFVKKRIILKGMFARDVNNASGWNSSTTTYIKMGYNLRLNFPKYPFLVIDFRPNSMKNDASVDTLKLDNNANVFSVMTGYNMNNSNLSNTVNFLFTSQSSKSKIGLNDYSIYNYFISDNLALVNTPINFGLSLGFTRNSALNATNSFTGDFSFGWSFLEVWTNTIGLNFTKEEGINNKTGIYFTSSTPITKYIDLNFYMEKSYYKETVFQYGKIEDLVLRMSISKSW